MSKFKMLLLLVVAMIIGGCATHTLQHDNELQSILNNWIGSSIEDFLDANPNVQNPIPIGNGRFRYTLIHNVDTDAEVLTAFANALSTTGPKTYRQDFYYVYVFVNEYGIIYKANYERKSLVY